MTELAAHGIGVTLPAGWEGRVFKRPLAGEVGAAAADGAPAAAGETTNAVVHVATIPLPAGTGDFASGAVEDLGRDDVLIVLFEYDAGSATQPLFAAQGLPTSLDPDDFNPNVLQRTIRGQAGVQKFFHDQDRAFCLYVVLGAFAGRQQLVPRVNQVLATMTIESVAPGGAPSTTTTTEPPTASTEVPTTEPPVTEAPSTEPSTTTSVP